MQKIKYNYPRTDINIRCSAECHSLVHQMADALGCSVQDAVIMCVLDKIDPTQTLPDWSPLPTNIK